LAGRALTRHAGPWVKPEDGLRMPRQSMAWRRLVARPIFTIFRLGAAAHGGAAAEKILNRKKRNGPGASEAERGALASRRGLRTLGRRHRQGRLDVVQTLTEMNVVQCPGGFGFDKHNAFHR
jgi:hypothetical protein